MTKFKREKGKQEDFTDSDQKLDWQIDEVRERPVEVKGRYYTKNKNNVKMSGP